MSEIKNCDIFIAAAAVADYCITNPSAQKIKKTTAAQTLELSPTPDILKTVAALPHPPFTIGFAAETENVLENAKKKLEAKHLDVVIANQVGPQQGFECDENAVTLIDRSGKIIEIPVMNKLVLARKLINQLFNSH
jgi:phosphopantothenoylcysteine decarboxylase/phosphopantothenate--cysteine ligase